MAKKYQISQKVIVNGETKTATFQMYGENDDVTALGALLAGGYEVKEVNESISDMTSADTNNATTNPVTAIYLSGEKNQIASIRPFQGVIHFKNTVSVDDIAGVLRNTTPFEVLPTAKPLKISVKRNETFAGATETP